MVGDPVREKDGVKQIQENLEAIERTLEIILRWENEVNQAICDFCFHRSEMVEHQQFYMVQPNGCKHCCCCLVAKPCPMLFNPMNCSPPASSCNIVNLLLLLF